MQPVFLIYNCLFRSVCPSQLSWHLFFSLNPDTYADKYFLVYFYLALESSVTSLNQVLIEMLLLLLLLFFFSGTVFLSLFISTWPYHYQIDTSFLLKDDNKVLFFFFRKTAMFFSLIGLGVLEVAMRQLFRTPESPEGRSATSYNSYTITQLFH